MLADIGRYQNTIGIQPFSTFIIVVTWHLDLGLTIKVRFVALRLKLEYFLDASPCCGQINITADPHHGVWMIHFNKLVSCLMLMISVI